MLHVLKTCIAGKNLQAQYERWQPRAKYKMHLDPTVDDAKKVAISCRRAAKVKNANWLEMTCLFFPLDPNSVIPIFP